MKRIVAFLLVLTVPLGLILGAHKAVDALKDDVTMESEVLWGDPALAEGMEVELVTTCGNHMYWLTGYRAGERETDSEFFFTQNYHGMDEHFWSEGSFNLYIVSGMGMSTSGGSGFELGDMPLGTLAAVVADKTEPGMTHTEQVKLAEHVDVYPMEYWCSIYSDRFSLEDSHDTVSIMDGTEYSRSYDTWMELFQFPVDPDATMEITVGKDYDGSIVDLSFNLVDGPEASFTSAIAGDGMYFSPVFRANDGTPIETGRYPEGNGIYYIPMTYADEVNPALVEEGDICAAQWDFDKLELMYPLGPGDEVAAMALSGDESRLHLILRQGQSFRYCALNAETGAVEALVDILTAEEGERRCEYQIFEQEELLFVSCGTQYALVDISGSGKTEFVLEKPEGMEMLPLPESIVYRDGVLWMTALNWYGSGRGFCLAVLSPEGVGYYGNYRTNLHIQDRGYGSNYVNLEKVEFLQNGQPG